MLFVSSELEEVLAVSDRIYVLHAGRITAEFENPRQLTQADLLIPAFGLNGAA